MSVNVLPDDQIPLCVDLDGTLVAGDLLWESLFVLLGREPWLLFVFPLWLYRGKASFKAKIADRIEISPETLPYHPELTLFLNQCRLDGRRLILATASDWRYAKAVADHLNLFDQVIATDGGINYSGSVKLRRIQQLCGDTFDYVGNSAADLPLWAAARSSYVVNASNSVLKRACAVCQPVRVFPRSGNCVRSIVRLVRPMQWSKNVLLFIPLLMSHQLDSYKWLQVSLAFLLLSGCASGTYIINDLTDIYSDRRHPRKHRRPLASGEISVPLGLCLACGLIMTTLAAALAFGSPVMALLLVGYVSATLLYSHVLKNKLFIDVLTLAGFYAYRLLLGAVVSDIRLSHWLLVFSVFLFLSLALAKRFAELAPAIAMGELNSRRGYRAEDLQLLGHLGPTCGYLACLVFLMYIEGDTATMLYPHPAFLWSVGPLFLYWITRVWFLAHRGELSDDPLVFAVKDRHTYVIGLLTLLCFLLAVWPF